MEIGATFGSPASPSLIATDDMAGQRALMQAVRAVNGAKLFGEDNELIFVVDRETHRPLLRIVNRETREVVRQIPPEHVIRLAEDLRRKT